MKILQFQVYPNQDGSESLLKLINWSDQMGMLSCKWEEVCCHGLQTRCLKVSITNTAFRSSKNKILSSFKHLKIVSNLYDFLSPAEHQRSFKNISIVFWSFWKANIGSKTN